MPYNVELTLYFVVLAAVCSAFCLWFLYGPIHRYLCKHHTVRMYYRTVYRVALDNDFYLINAFKNSTAELEEFHIDHILIGNKYFYCVRDRYYDGALAAKENNMSWLFFHKDKATYIPNAVAQNRLRIQRLSLMSGIEEKMFINVVLINDDCFLSPFDNDGEDTFLVSLKDFPALIEQLEARPIDPLDQQAIAVAARDFAELNQNHAR